MKTPLAIALLASALTLSVSHASTVVVGFEGGSGRTTTYEEGDYRFVADVGTLIFTDNRNIPDSGSRSMLVNAGSGAAAPALTTLTTVADTTFNLDSFRASEGRNVDTRFFPRFGSSSVVVTGFYEGGGSISRTFELDLIADDNALIDFETFDVWGFTNLTSVTFEGGGAVNGYSFSLDDVQVTAVPVPAAVWLLLSALGSLAWRSAGRVRC